MSRIQNNSRERQVTGFTGSPHEVQAFEKNIDKHYDDVFREALRLTRNRAEAEGVTQATLLKFLDLMDRKDWKVEINDLKAYLKSIAKHVWSDRMQHQRKEKDPLHYDDKKDLKELELDPRNRRDDTGDIESRIYYKELSNTIPWRLILRDTTDYERKLFRMRYIDEMSFKEIGAQVQKDPIVVKYELDRLMAKIRYRVKSLSLEADRQMLRVWKTIHEKRDEFAS